MKPLIFYEETYSPVVVDEDIITEYLDNCKEHNIIPLRDDFMDWLTSNYLISDLIDENNQDIDYTLTDKVFNKYLENFNND